MSSHFTPDFFFFFNSEKKKEKKKKKRGIVQFPLGKKKKKA